MIDLMIAFVSLFVLSGIAGVFLLFSLVMRVIARRERDELAALSAWEI